MQTKMTLDEWRQRAVELFGDDEMKWRFVCPCCGHVQTIVDFRPYKDRGATTESAFQECVGRYTGVKEMRTKGEGPCDYAAFGLFRLSPTVVIAGDGTEIQAFGFDETAAKTETAPLAKAVAV